MFKTILTVGAANFIAKMGADRFILKADENDSGFIQVDESRIGLDDAVVPILTGVVYVLIRKFTGGGKPSGS